MSEVRSKDGYVENAMLLGRTVFRLVLSLDLNTTFANPTPIALEWVGDMMLELPEELLLLEIDIGDIRSLEHPDPDSDKGDPSVLHDVRPSLLWSATLANMEPVGELTDNSEPVGEPRLLTDIGEVGSDGFVSDMVALMERFRAPDLLDD